MFDEIYQGLLEALMIERGEIRLIPHPAQDKLPAPTFIAVSLCSESADEDFLKEQK